jgi:cytochrome c oxidase cbb3-type subunit III
MKGWAVLFAILLLGACEREQRQFRGTPAESSSNKPAGTRYDENAYYVSQGKTLFRWFNCSGCHANGGGGMGPALMDNEWRYGSEVQTLYQTIMDGRPNGMPAFRGRINEDQVWQLVAYIRSMPRLISKDVAPGRTESLSPGEAESSRDRKR